MQIEIPVSPTVARLPTIRSYASALPPMQSRGGRPRMERRERLPYLAADYAEGRPRSAVSAASAPTGAFCERAAGSRRAAVAADVSWVLPRTSLRTLGILACRARARGCGCCRSNGLGRRSRRHTRLGGSASSRRRDSGVPRRSCSGLLCRVTRLTLSSLLRITAANEPFWYVEPIDLGQ